MASATLSFDLPEDDVEFHTAARAMDYKLVIFDVLMEIRSAIRHDSGRFSLADRDTLEMVATFLREQAAERHLDLES